MGEAQLRKRRSDLNEHRNGSTTTNRRIRRRGRARPVSRYLPSLFAAVAVQKNVRDLSDPVRLSAPELRSMYKTTSVQD